MEPELYCLENERLDRYLRDNLFKGSEDFWEHIVSSSRMCGLRPHAISGNASWPRNRYTAESFALIHRQYIEDYPVTYDYITAIIGNEFIPKALTIRNSGKYAHPLFVPASKTLRVKEENIKLDRSIYAYKFPTYWFSAKDLLKFIESLLDSGRLAPETLIHYFGVKDVHAIGAEDLRIFSELFFSERNLEGSSVNGAELRKLGDNSLKERPRLRIVPALLWNEAIREMIRISGILFFK
jgi:hypothetical protein